MKCKSCKKPAVYLNPTLCKNHFLSYIEKKVFGTISKYKLLKPSDKIIIAASGGKDSLTLLNILSKKFKVNCIAVDEGIDNYRESTLKTLKAFCRKRKIPLKIVSFKKEFGGKLDAFIFPKQKPCAVCGTLRRYLMNKHSKKFDKICTGHNLDDESQSVLMNLIKPNTSLNARGGPITGLSSVEGFTQKIKPLYFLKEKEIMTYAFLNNLLDEYIECPNAVLSYRAKVRDLLNDYEEKHSGTKKNIIEFFLRNKPKISRNILQEEIHRCKKCGEPSKGEVCSACIIVGK